MFGSEMYERMQAAMGDTQPKNNEDAQKKREAERAIEESGRGTCQSCGAEIIKNDSMGGGGWTWESELLLGFCDVAKDHKHRPRVVWTAEEGVHNA